MYTPPGVPRSRSLTRFTMRVGLLHLGQSVLLDVSITFLRSAVLAILAMETLSPQSISLQCLGAFASRLKLGSSPTKLGGRTPRERYRRTSTRFFYFTTSCKQDNGGCIADCRAIQVAELRDRTINRPAAMTMHQRTIQTPHNLQIPTRSNPMEKEFV